MKIKRSVKCSTKFMTQRKQEQLRFILKEYASVCNYFIDYFWENTTEKKQLLKPIVDLPNTWLSARLRKVAAREAIDMVNSVKNNEDLEIKTKPTHSGKRMCVSSTIAELQLSRDTIFDAWLHLHSVGRKTIFNIPIKFHKQFNKWNLLGKRLNSYIITSNYIQFVFEIETGFKNNKGLDIGIDTGIDNLASLSNGRIYGQQTRELINKINRKKHGSKKQKRTRRQLRQYMNETIKEIIVGEKPRTIVVERLNKISKDTKKRVGKKTRRLIGNWNYRYWLGRIQQKCEENRIFFRSVLPYNTSIMCSNCGNVDKKQRNGLEFKCEQCGHIAQADINAAINILNRCLRGVYGPPSAEPEDKL